MVHFARRTREFSFGLSNDKNQILTRGGPPKSGGLPAGRPALDQGFKVVSVHFNPGGSQKVAT